jgi:hypothetical protein
LFINGGVQRGKAPLLGVWGYPPVPKFPQDWGIKGVEKTFVNALGSKPLDFLLDYSNDVTY